MPSPWETKSTTMPPDETVADTDGVVELPVFVVSVMPPTYPENDLAIPVTNPEDPKVATMLNVPTGGFTR